MSGIPTAGELDVRQLDTGPYPTTPIEIGAEYGYDMLGAQLLASMRLADHVVAGSGIDPKLAFGSGALVDHPENARFYLSEANLDE
ncbi:MULTISPECIES: hypothetical protein [unclassified Nocardia]|uniref:hypothetical protein n=1 Tax=unclassified Nocardia TaxID=2637762 RepID=UPI001CE47AD1|nr:MULTISPECIES: hypothetical protein [unclassified Nocardia]